MAVRIYGNREIKTLPGEATRPTSARVREALFNIWQGRILGCRWLDLCAGSGAMGAEALCRGASEVVGIEKFACGLPGGDGKLAKGGEKRSSNLRVHQGDVVQQMKQMAAGPQFDCIYFDPPYAGNLYDLVLPLLADCLSLHGEAAVEYSRAHWQAERTPENLVIVKEKRYGSTYLIFLRRQIACDGR
ncbi:MAG: 16S rRNA (guanine(966)-N(2))-methyltransferase RsmD [Phormidesmis sp. RL_2_1]|nr:16S rRNA (guanine(966)-N(2))-methyltransferase RsmD [Phormidesmis sp. RL_2_1]